MNTTLIVMAAGMGSRFGGLKQAAPVTDDGKGILDFSVYDAKKAGFNKVIFIVREDMKEDFHELIGKRIAKTIDVSYVIQDMTCLPEGRKKPFGTAHAVLCCRDLVNEPFAIINADDYYGANAFTEISKHLKSAKPGEYAMTAYKLKNTLSENGTVSRGVCVTENGYLKKISEITDIDNKCRYDNGTKELSPESCVSMNLWGLTPDIFDIIDEKYKKFLAEADIMKDEFYIPLVVGETLEEGKSTVKVYENTDKWFGITYREDLAEMKEAIRGYIDAGLYEGI